MLANLTRTLCTRNLNQQLTILRSSNIHPVRCVSIKIVPPEKDTLSFTEKNQLLKREMSPHLTIYKPELTSMLSITHRFMGMALTGYAAALGLGALVFPHDFSHFITMVEGLNLSAPTLGVIKFYLAFPATYHTANGIRHLLWDNGKFLKLKEVYTTGYIMLAVSVVTAAILSAV